MAPGGCRHWRPPPAPGAGQPSCGPSPLGSQSWMPGEHMGTAGRGPVLANRPKWSRSVWLAATFQLPAPEASLPRGLPPPARPRGSGRGTLLTPSPTPVPAGERRGDPGTESSMKKPQAEATSRAPAGRPGRHHGPLLAPSGSLCNPRPPRRCGRPRGFGTCPWLLPGFNVGANSTGNSKRTRKTALGAGREREKAAPARPSWGTRRPPRVSVP